MIHVASPFFLTTDDPQHDLIDPAVDGTLNILGAAAKSSSVRRVVLTSSVAAMVDAADGRTITEDDWNDRSTLDHNPYSMSKAVAERAAWRFVEASQPSFDLVVINPALVLGPAHSPSIGTSMGVIAGFLNGKTPAIIDLDFGIVDVRDVARAHVAAMDDPGATGRYLCCNAVLTSRQITETLRTNGYEAYKLPKLALDNPVGSQLAKLIAYTLPKGTKTIVQTSVGRRLRYDNSKIRKDLGVEFMPVEQTLLDAAADLQRWGHVPAL